MKLIMHCGEGKTGSTSIQVALHSSSEKLMKQGILYYSSTPKNGHFDFSYIIGRRHRVSIDVDKMIMDRVRKTISEIQRLAKETQPEFVILSSEGFFNYKKDEIKKTIAALELNFTGVYCIIYVRYPPELYLSIIQQKIKGSHDIINPITFSRDIVSSLTRWQKFCGKNNFFGSIFQKKSLRRGGVVEDFKNKLEAITRQKVDFNIDLHQNKSLTAEQMILLQDFRYDFLRDHDGQMVPQSSNLISFFSALNQFVELGTKPKLRPEITEMILINNHKYILGVNDLFGGNSCMDLNVPRGRSIFSYEGKPPITKVRDILLHYDQNIYFLLKSLIVEYGQDLCSAYGDFLAIFGDAGESRSVAAKIYFDYLRSNNYFSDDQLKNLENIDVKHYDRILFDMLKKPRA